MKVINGNNIDILKQYPDNYFDAIVTDPPYGLGKEPNSVELMKDWIEKGYHEVGGSGFMGKEWDAFVPQPLFWKEAFRVLKHGGHVLSFFGTRTYDWGVMAMRFAGFEVRDTITWHYGSGFPKSHNISKALDKMAGAEREVVGKGISGKPESHSSSLNMSQVENNTFGGEFNITASATDAAKQWDGWGTALKPASEPIVLARKPLEKGLSIAENVLKYGTGGINIDGCRVAHNEEQKFANRKERGAGWNMENCGFDSENNNTASANEKGRFPANVIFTHHPDCECVGTKKVKPSNESGKASEKGGGFSKGMFGDGTSDNIGGGFTDADGMETMEDWNCVDGCPIKELDEQSVAMGMHFASVKRNKEVISEYENSSFHAPTTRQMNRFGDKGGASRFFYCPKASKSERNKGLEEFEEKENLQGLDIRGRTLEREDGSKSLVDRFVPSKRANIHPTVKPVALMQYLIRLITPPNGKILDPFCGSGTTGVACKIEGFDFVGMEQDPEYCKIAEARINNYIDSKDKNEKTLHITNKQQSLF